MRDKFEHKLAVMKTAIFVDVQNIYYTTRDTFKRSFNYKRFWNQIESNNEIIIANAYAVDIGDEKQKKFQYALQTIGFNVKLKPYISRTDGSAKGDWDVGITIDILDYALPFGYVGLLFHPFMIKPKLKEIFNYREKKLIEMFGKL